MQSRSFPELRSGSSHKRYGDDRDEFPLLLHRYAAQVRCSRKEERVVDVPLNKYLLKIM